MVHGVWKVRGLEQFGLLNEVTMLKQRMGLRVLGTLEELMDTRRLMEASVFNDVWYAQKVSRDYGATIAIHLRVAPGPTRRCSKSLAAWLRLAVLVRVCFQRMMSRCSPHMPTL